MESKNLDLSTNYMGIPLKNPLIVGACSLSKKIDQIKELERAGASALVIKSLFEEQVQLERNNLEEALTQYDELYAEATSLYPRIEHAGASAHLYWVSKTKKEVAMPLIASLNAVHDDVWVTYARQLAETGVDGLELNFYTVPLDPSISASEIEKKEFETFSKIRDSVKIPLAVKLHPYYTNVLYIAEQFSKLGANAVVLFNRFIQPDLNTREEKEQDPLLFSEPRDILIPLRFTGLLSGRIKSDISASSGISSGQDVIKLILAGASTVQIVSALYRNKADFLSKTLQEIEEWMQSKGYRHLEDFRGHTSKNKVKDPWAYERSQYIKAVVGYD